VKSALIGWLACVTVALEGTAAAQRDAVPSHLLAAVERPLMEFVAQLAHASIPTGVEVREIDHELPRPPFVRPTGQEEVVPRAQLVTAFNGRNPDYRAAWVGNVFMIRPVRGRVNFLDSRSSIVSETTVIGIDQTLRTILSPLNPRLLAPVLGAGSGREALKGLTAQIVLNGANGRTVIDTLNQVVLQFPGAWHVRTRRQDGEWQISGFGFVYSDFISYMAPMPPQAR
jgi:hypothetical protein